MTVLNVKSPIFIAIQIFNPRRADMFPTQKYSIRIRTPEVRIDGMGFFRSDLKTCRFRSGRGGRRRGGSAGGVSGGGGEEI